MKRTISTMTTTMEEHGSISIVATNDGAPVEVHRRRRAIVDPDASRAAAHHQM